MSTLRDNKRLERFKFQVQNGDQQQERWVLISARYFEAQGFAEGVLLDITEQYNQMMELQRVNTELDNFVYHASHDLRSPLTSIMGLVNLGLKEPSLEVVQGYLHMIRGRINHLDNLLRDLISISHNSRAGNEYELFNFKEEADSILKLLKNPDQNFEVTLTVEQPVDFKTDPVRMRTIIQNLLSNAFKYFNPEIKTPCIQLTIRVRHSHCSILLRDNGIGIRQEYKSRIYEMFFRGTERSAGTGLGLYIVKATVEKLKGRISFESTVNVGTTFLLTVPNQIPEALPFKITNPINSFAILPRQLELVETSWDLVLLNAQETSAAFYGKLFSLDSALRHMFKGDMSTQAQKFVAMITFAIHKLSNLEDILEDMKTLGALHKTHHVTIQHYETVADALLWALEKAVGGEWNDEIKNAWMSVYSTISKAMMNASH